MRDLGFFSEKEIACNCGCGQMIVEPLFLSQLNSLRLLMGLPLIVTSWNRCQTHNVLSGGSDTSSHLIGWACDIRTLTELFRYMILCYAGEVGFRGVGIAKSFIHLDNDPDKSNHRIWIY